MQQKIILSGAQVRQFLAKEETFPALTLGLSCLTSPGKSWTVQWTASQMEEFLILFKQVKGEGNVDFNDFRVSFKLNKIEVKLT